MFLDDLPICVEKDRCLDMPEFFLWSLKLAEVIEQEDRAKIMEYEEGKRYVFCRLCAWACTCFGVATARI